MDKKLSRMEVERKGKARIKRGILVVGAVVVGDSVVKVCDWHVRRSLINFAVF